ncbi:MAG: hypothetical protein ACTS8R_08035 [Arsenophonus sp. NC-QC1-MAG3]
MLLKDAQHRLVDEQLFQSPVTVLCYSKEYKISIGDVEIKVQKVKRRLQAATEFVSKVHCCHLI